MWHNRTAWSTTCLWGNNLIVNSVVFSRQNNCGIFLTSCVRPRLICPASKAEHPRVCMANHPLWRPWNAGNSIRVFKQENVVNSSLLWPLASAQYKKSPCRNKSQRAIKSFWSLKVNILIQWLGNLNLIVVGRLFIDIEYHVRKFKPLKFSPSNC